MPGEQNILHVVHVGVDSFPCGLAGMQKLLLISKALLHAGCRVSVINRWWSHEKCFNDVRIETRGVYEEIEYEYASGVSTRPNSFIARRFHRLRGRVVEVWRLVGLSRRSKRLAVIAHSLSFWKIFYYRVLSKLLSFPLIVNYAELRSAIKSDGKLTARMNAYLFDHHVFKFVDGVLPISEYLVENATTHGRGTPYLKVPVLVDCRRYECIHPKADERYLLYCGALGYAEIIHFILDVFDALHCDGNLQLYLVVNGEPFQFASLRERLAHTRRRDAVKTYTQLTDAKLSELYFNAYALLIPLRPTLKDIARFPHKIGEYCASGRPIVTTNYGEIPVYFRDRETAFIAPSYSVDEYRQQLELVLSDPELASRVGSNGKRLAEREFDYRVYSDPLRNFIQSLGSQR